LGPAFDGGDDFFRIFGPREGFGVPIMFGQIPSDSDLQIDHACEHSVLGPTLCENAEEAFDGFEPGCGGWREMGR
jgi:hypothetical protein